MLEVESAGETVFLRVRLPPEVQRLTVLYGSIAIDGISLTVNRLMEDVAEVAIIPYTFQHTNVSRLHVGDRVNLEADMIGKYVDRLLEPYRRTGASAVRAEDRIGT
jgi:riboflavin synthase